MSGLAVTGIGRLITWDPERPVLEHAALLASDGVIAWVGEGAALPEAAGAQRLDAGGRCVVPGFVDAHTHLVFAGDRAAEFSARMAGEPYAAGGIRTTVAATRAANDAELLAGTRRRVAEALRSGTTSLEIKSGYGLTVTDEVRCLRVAREAGAVATTFLGAHVVPDGDPDAYVALVTGPMLDACAPLADAIDAFCEDGAFDVDQARVVLEAGKGYGLALRLHTGQLGPSGGVQLAAELGARSVDHCTHLSDADVDAIVAAGLVATLVPAAEFSTRSPYAPGRRLLDAGATVALATDCNPGTSFTTSMPFVIALAVRELRLSVDEAVRAATLGGAAALQRPDLGHLGVGAAADFVVLDAPNEAHLAYRPGVDLVTTVVRRGAVVDSPDAQGLRAHP